MHYQGFAKIISHKEIYRNKIGATHSADFIRSTRKKTPRRMDAEF